MARLEKPGAMKRSRAAIRFNEPRSRGSRSLRGSRAVHCAIRQILKERHRGWVRTGASVRAGRTPFFSGFSASSATARGGRSRLWSETRRCCCRGLLQAPGSTRLHRQTNPPWTVPIERNFARAGSCQGKYSEKEKSLSKRGNPREREKNHWRFRA